MQDSCQTNWNFWQDKIKFCRTGGLSVIKLLSRSARNHRTFVRQTETFCRTEWKFAGFVRQSCSFRKDCGILQKPVLVCGISSKTCLGLWAIVKNSFEWYLEDFFFFFFFFESEFYFVISRYKTPSEIRVIFSFGIPDTVLLPVQASWNVMHIITVSLQCLHCRICAWGFSCDAKCGIKALTPYVNSEIPDQLAYLCSLLWTSCVRRHILQ